MKTLNGIIAIHLPVPRSLVFIASVINNASPAGDPTKVQFPLFLVDGVQEGLQVTCGELSLFEAESTLPCEASEELELIFSIEK